MFKVGQIFNKDGHEFCVLDILHYNMKQYLLFSVEKEKIEYLFYEVLQSEIGYNLVLVEDEATNFALFELVENNKE